MTQQTKIALELALRLIQDTWPYEHGNRQVGEAWGAIESALEAINKELAS